MGWTDLIDTAFEVAADSGRANQVEAAVTDGGKPVATPTTSARGHWCSPPTACSS
ncbi:hypothetical protein [Kitasatospora sp. NPDC056531]|uniref:hypothetical protein n=1 Tax=Kitasatospora sp. NPDC056531 TaxID=3345856 RepID=UPI0036BF615B